MKSGGGFLTEEHYGIKIPPDWSALKTKIITYFPYSICHCIVHFLSGIMFDDFCSAFSPAAALPATPQLPQTSCCSGAAQREAITGNGTKSFQEFLVSIKKKAKSASTDSHELISGTTLRGNMAQRTFVLSNKVNMHNYSKFQKCLAVTLPETNKQSEWAKALLKIPLAAYFPLQQSKHFQRSFPKLLFWSIPKVLAVQINLVEQWGLVCDFNEGRKKKVDNYSNPYLLLGW